MRVLHAAAGHTIAKVDCHERITTNNGDGIIQPERDRLTISQIRRAAAAFVACLLLSIVARADEFPAELTRFEPGPANPIFTAEGPGHWDVKMRERGWILREGATYSLWFTGYDGTREGLKMLGYATSSDGIHWTRDPRIRFTAVIGSRT